MSSLAIFPSSNALSSLTRPMGLGGRKTLSSSVREGEC
jgi:hypothetical protein